MAPTARSSADTPIIPGFFPDPSICRAGEDYVIVHSTFEYSPAVPLWHSRDLVNWTLAGHALDGDPRFVPGNARAGGGVYAPTIRHHDGRFWMITTDVSGGKGQLITSATEITGPWMPSVRIDGILGIDPDLAWDSDGTCYVTFSSNDQRAPGIAQVRVDLAEGRVIEGPYTVYEGTGAAYPEGPHLFRRGPWWYLLFAEGGTERGHCISVARGTSPTGPFHANPNNPILTRRSTTFPVQNTGHGDLVECVDGSWALVYLGVRPRGGTPMWHTNGRETFLAGIDWVDDWPVVVPDRFDLPDASTGFVDRFDTDRLDLRWISPGPAIAEFAHPTSDGVVISPASSQHGVPGVLATRTRDLAWRFEAELAAGSTGTVHLRMDDHHWCEVRRTSTGVEVEVVIGQVRQVFLADSRDPAVLCVAALAPTFGGPDDLTFAVRDADGERELARIDGRYLSTEVAGGFVGRVIGLRALHEPAVFRQARYEPGEDPAVPVWNIDEPPTA